MRQAFVSKRVLRREVIVVTIVVNQIKATLVTLVDARIGKGLDARDEAERCGENSNQGAMHLGSS